MLAKFGKGIRAALPVLLEVIGLAVVALGVGMIYVPAGVIVAGVAAAFLGYATGAVE